MSEAEKASEMFELMVGKVKLVIGVNKVPSTDSVLGTNMISQLSLIGERLVSHIKSLNASWTSFSPCRSLAAEERYIQNIE